MFEKIWDKKIAECVGTDDTWEGIYRVDGERFLCRLFEYSEGGVDVSFWDSGVEIYEPEGGLWLIDDDDENYYLTRTMEDLEALMDGFGVKLVEYLGSEDEVPHEVQNTDPYDRWFTPPECGDEFCMNCQSDENVICTEHETRFSEEGMNHVVYFYDSYLCLKCHASWTVEQEGIMDTYKRTLKRPPHREGGE